MPLDTARSFSYLSLLLGGIAMDATSDSWFAGACVAAVLALRLQPWDPYEDNENPALRALEAE